MSARQGRCAGCGRARRTAPPGGEVFRVPPAPTAPLRPPHALTRAGCDEAAFGGGAAARTRLKAFRAGWARNEAALQVRPGCQETQRAPAAAMPFRAPCSRDPMCRPPPTGAPDGHHAHALACVTRHCRASCPCGIAGQAPSRSPAWDSPQDERRATRATLPLIHPITRPPRPLLPPCGGGPQTTRDPPGLPRLLAAPHPTTPPRSGRARAPDGACV